MIKVEKDFSNIPSVLKKENRKEAFNHNVSLGCYDDANNRYKVTSVQNRLNKIYNLKCAYCEQTLLDAPKHIEHYRPKNIYYWLAYSWDNLLLSCGSCNSKKSNNFKTNNSAVVYTNESFETIDDLGNIYDEMEEPFVVNPEKEDVLELILYRKNAEVFSNDVRVSHTIESACGLNRKELLEKREEIINDFIFKIEEHYTLFQKYQDITRFLPEVRAFILKVSRESEFYSLRYYILHHIEEFFENENIQTILIKLIDKVQNEE
jgi:uncharacterized protein (TIGR02646 family)